MRRRRQAQHLFKLQDQRQGPLRQSYRLANQQLFATTAVSHAA